MNTTQYEKWIQWFIRITNRNEKIIVKVVQQMTWPTFHQMRKELGLGKSKKRCIRDIIQMKHIDECMARLG